MVGLLEVLPRGARLFQTCLFLNEIGGFAPSSKKKMHRQSFVPRKSRMSYKLECEIYYMLVFFYRTHRITVHLYIKREGDKPKGPYKAEILPKEQKGKEKQHKKKEQDQGSRCLRTQPHSYTICLLYAALCVLLKVLRN